MKILVTGGAGFIGSNMVDTYIQAGHTVAVLDNFSTGKREYVNTAVANVFELDIRDPAVRKAVTDFAPDVINHHAAQISVGQSLADPLADADVNLLGTINLLEAARLAGVQRFIFASSGGALNGLPIRLPTPEDDPITPLSPYGASKAAAEHYLRMYQLTHDIEWVALRYSNVYGPRQYRGGECGVIGLFLHDALAGQPITVFGDGTQTRDFVFVGDVAQANLQALTLGSRAINVSSGTEITINDLTRLIGSAIGRKLTADTAPARVGDIHRSCLNRTVAEATLDWRPTTNLEDGLAATVAWLRDTYHLPAPTR